MNDNGFTADRFTGRCRACGGELPETGFHSCNITGVILDAPVASTCMECGILRLHIATLERALAEARAQNAHNVGLLEVIEQQGVALEAETQRHALAEAALAALREQRCETCRRMRDDDHVGEPCCTISLTWIPCRALGNGCRAWSGR